ncbi:hypothetical protein Pan97_42440 [Bremerella volcania]|uniref:DUF2262 domain-containing protein n=1 Tax=Bremerella volcania TaxID=2527984 RepID=A0A518CDA0_9BACT|nr:DUF2262 domain-containing protein [Bremerella volcania]QDU77182.1 hypothetical protein Pan97_42440 [Bremerella volcania]
MPQKKASNTKRTTPLADVINDRVLGKLVFSTALDQTVEFQGKVKLSGRTVTMDLYTDAEGKLGPCILRARRIVENFPAIEIKMQNYIAKKIFPSYNETFRPGKKPFALDQLLSKLKLRFVTTHPEPRATFWFEAGNAFAGHGLQLFMAERNRIVDHDMPG